MIKTQTSFVQMYQHSHIFSVKEELNASDRQLNSAVIPGSTYCVSQIQWQPTTAILSYGLILFDM